MSESSRSRAEQYLNSCATKIAPYWLPHYGVKVPPVEITDFFDQCVANIIAAEPGLALELGYSDKQQSELKSDLLDMVINEAHREVRKIQYAALDAKVQTKHKQLQKIPDPSTEQAEHLRRRRSAEVIAQAEQRIKDKEEQQARDLKAQKNNERIAFLRSKIAAKEESLEAEINTEVASQKAETAKQIIEQQSALLQSAKDRWPTLTDFERGVRVLATFIREACGEEQARTVLDNSPGFYVDGPRQSILEMKFDSELENTVDIMLKDSRLDPIEKANLEVYQGLFAHSFARLFQALLDELNVNKLPLQLRTTCLAMVYNFASLEIPKEELFRANPRKLTRVQWLTGTGTRVFGSHWSHDRPFEFTKTPMSRLEPFPHAIVIKTVFDEISAGADLFNRKRAEHQRRVEEARRNLSKWQEIYPHPGKQSYGVSPNGAEHWVKDWCLHMGMEGASVTQQSGDGGIDIVSPTYIAQVKHYSGTVGIAAIREFVGVAAADGRKAVFFTSGSYPASANQFADQMGVALFRYDVFDGIVEATSSTAEQMLVHGFLHSTRTTQLSN